MGQSHTYIFHNHDIIAQNKSDMTNEKRTSGIGKQPTMYFTM